MQGGSDAMAVSAAVTGAGCSGSDLNAHGAQGVDRLLRIEAWQRDVENVGEAVGLVATNERWESGLECCAKLVAGSLHLVATYRQDTPCLIEGRG